APYQLRGANVPTADASPIDGPPDATHPPGAALLHGSLEDLGNVAVKGKSSGNAWPRPRGKWLSPSTFFSHQIQDGAHAGLIAKELAAQFIRIFSSRVSHFVEKTLDRKARVRVADGAPPLHWDADFRSVQVNLKIRNSV